MKKVFTAFLAVAAVAGTLAASTSSADAQRWRHGPGAGAVIGGVAAGALLGAAIAGSGPVYAAPPPDYYYGYGPGPVYVEEPPCRVVRERFWDGYAWRARRVQVCD
ncbi:MAG: hypothetical protein EPO23_09345 [Xanthobacteraceae bacterium]|nr:MAG: hypothetical protein EPO23_09345 [Xanthobacteraceae bacterium]